MPTLLADARGHGTTSPHSRRSSSDVCDAWLKASPRAAAHSHSTSGMGRATSTPSRNRRGTGPDQRRKKSGNVHFGPGGYFS